MTLKVTGGAYDTISPPTGLDPQVAALDKKARAFDLTLTQAALQFAMHQPAACSVLLGAGRVSSLQRNLDALKIPLSDAALSLVTT